MYVCYKRESLFFGDFLAFFCVIIFAYVVSVSFGVGVSQNEARIARQKKLFIVLLIVAFIRVNAEKF